MSRFSAVALASVLTLSGALLTTPVQLAAHGAVSGSSGATEQTKRVRCHGQIATIVGNRRSNTIEGTPRRDVIAGRGGGDVIIGRGGKDLICGGGGGDILAGLQGRDRLYGGAKRDQCFGERREHRLHFGCEVHRNPLGAPVHHPSHPRMSQGSHAATLPTAATTSFRGQATADRPYCREGNINLGRFYFVAQQGNWVAVRPVYATWNDFGGGYGGDVAATDWQLWNAPADGQYHYVEMGSFNLSANSVWGYQVYWWDGGQWVDGQLVGIPKFDNAGASAAFTYTLGSCVT